MHQGQRTGIPTIIPFSRRKSESNIPTKPPTKQDLPSDLLESRFNYLQGCFNAFDEFENTKNVNVLKEFVINNSISLKQMIDQLYLLKEVVDAENKDVALIFDKELQKTVKHNETLKRQLQIQKKKEERLKHQYQLQNSGNKGQQQIALLEQTIVKLRKQGEELSRRNQGIAPSLARKNFFKQFQKMHKECQGLHRQNDKLKEIIKQKKQQLQILRLQGR